MANRGNGFRKKDFVSITNIALSSKPVNESIGNKGLGFRSVLQICKWPEVYSVNGSVGQKTFDGFCFRFADESALTQIMRSEAEVALAAEICATMPPWFLPVYASERPGEISHFANEGFSTVVRMPLKSEEAKEAVKSKYSISEVWQGGFSPPAYPPLNSRGSHTAATRTAILLPAESPHVLRRPDIDRRTGQRRRPIDRFAQVVVG